MWLSHIMITNYLSLLICFIKINNMKPLQRASDDASGSQDLK